MPPNPHSLTVAAPSGQALSPAQRKFNQLVQKIAKLRAELQAWDAAEAGFMLGWSQRVQPLQGELAVYRIAIARKMHAMIGAKGWTRTERATLRELLCHLTANLIDDEQVDEEHVSELKAMHDAHAEVDFDTAAAADMAGMKDLFEAMSGLDLGNEPVTSEDELMRRAFSRMQDQAQHEPPAAAAASGRRQTAAQRRQEQAQKDASQSLREVFRKLVSALHPDRADDEADRVRRTALMQRVNQAYEVRDLLGLFALQLEIEQIDATHLATATAEKARHCNRVLADQVEELKTERLGRETALRMCCRLDPYEPLTPRRLAPLLDREVYHLRAMLAEARGDLEGLDQPAFAKRWLKARRAELKAIEAAGDSPFDLSF